MKVNNSQQNYAGSAVQNRDKVNKVKASSSNIETQKLELVRLRIRNKFYERDEILRKVVQEMYEYDVRYK